MRQVNLVMEKHLVLAMPRTNSTILVQVCMYLLSSAKRGSSNCTLHFLIPATNSSIHLLSLLCRCMQCMQWWSRYSLHQHGKYTTVCVPRVCPWYHGNLANYPWEERWTNHIYFITVTFILLFVRLQINPARTETDPILRSLLSFQCAVQRYWWQVWLAGCLHWLAVSCALHSNISR